MFAWMILVRFALLPGHPLHPDEPAFWFSMSVGMLLGFATAWPVNVWLLRRGLKEAM